MVKRIVVEKSVDSKILGDKIVLPTSKRIAKNRFLKSALSEYAAWFTPDNPATHGLPTQVHVNMYEKWNAGGFGITVTGNVMIDQNHLESPGNTIIQKELESPEKRKVWKEIAQNAKKHGNLIVAQLGHAGRQTPKFLNPKPFSSSTVGLKVHALGREFGDPVELTTEQIQTEVVDKFVYAAKFLFDAGFDGIQVHAAHGYLIAQFLSRTTNKRTDKYGGSAKNRAQILVDVYNAIRQEIPAKTGFIIGAKLNSVEFQNEGLSTEEAQEVAQTLDEAGFDFLELSGGTYEQLGFEHKKESTIKREAYFVEFAAQIKPTLKNAKIYLTGGFRTTPAMVAAVNDGITDGIGLGRPATQDFDLPAKILSQKVESAAQYPFGDDITAGVLACSLQMSQAGQKSLAESSSINEGIMDLSDDKTVQEYVASQGEFLLSVLEAGKEGKIKYGLVPYKLDGFAGGLFDSKLAQKVKS